MQRSVVHNNANATQSAMKMLDEDEMEMASLCFIESSILFSSFNIAFIFWLDIFN